MNRFTTVFCTLISTVCCSVAIGLFAAHSYAEDEPVVSVTPIKGPLHLLQGKGGNIVASVGADGILIVDSDYGEFAPAHASALAQLSPEPARFVLNTHWHWDHTEGNRYWGENNAVIVAHENVRQRMSTRQEMRLFGRVVEPSPAAALPVVTYGDSLALHFNGDDIEVQHFPSGHTDGDSIVFFSKQNVVHMGDHMFAGFPFVDLGSGGNAFGLIANLEQVLARVDDETTIVPGHGKTTVGKADLAAYHQVLVTTSTIVKEALAQGETVEQITQRGLGEQYAAYGKGFVNEERWISFIADSL
jgi:cyclase